MGKRTDFKNKLSIAVIGRSGSGKGTQVEFLQKKLGFKNVRHLETGYFFRKLSDTDTISGNTVRKFIKQGKFPPWWFAPLFWLKEIVLGNCIRKHIVFDGSPRRLAEAKLIDEVLLWHARKPVLALYIDISPKEATKRLLLRKRSDDTPAVIKERLKQFTYDVLPVIKYYRSRGRLIHINGEQSVQAVWKEIDSALSKCLKRLWSKS